MDETKKIPELPQDDNWLDELLDAPDLGAELKADEQAVYAAGLTHPDDAELERIIQETKADDWLEAPVEEEPQQEPFRDQEYRDTFGNGNELAAVFSDTPDSQELVYADEAYLEDAENAEDAEPEAGEDEEEPAPPKGRPRRKKGYGLFGIPHLIATVIWLAIAVFIGVSLGRMVWVCAADMLAFGREDSVVSVTITASDNIDTIASKLRNEKLIKYPELFKLFVRIKGDEEELSNAGTFELNTRYDYNALVNALKPHSPAREVVEVMIPEGYSCAQIFALLEEKGVCTAEALEEYAANGELKDYWFLEGVERGSKYCLEGFLFPDTYQFYTNDTPGRVLTKMLGDSVGGFEVRFTDLMKERFETMQERYADMLRDNGYGQGYIDEHQLTLYDVVILASIVEKESANITESYTVASVFYNRLTNPSYPKLQSDATVYYAIGGASSEELTQEDLATDSPYNTYKYDGLPIGPISNPGQNSLNSALEPDDTSYYFFFYDSSAGVHRFARNLREHEDNIDRYGD